MSAPELGLSRRELVDRLVHGHPIDPRALDDSEYRGVSLGLPAAIERITWKVFKKAFHRDPADGVLRGWNVRLEQRGVGGPCVPLVRRGKPLTFGHFRVRPTDARTPHGLAGRLLLDYGLGRNPRLDPTALVRDVIVALEPGRADRLLGWMYLELGGVRARTPSFFLLEREGPLGEPVAPPRADER